MLTNLKLPTRLNAWAKFLSLAVLLGATGVAFATPQIQHWQAPSGARVYFVENHDLPMLDPQPLSDKPKHNPGAAHAH